MYWHTSHLRPMPWKGERDPYKIWLSEIILQQTRVEQGLPYYEKFIAAYPTVSHLADASQDEVLKNWEGLGYYSRARNMHATAKYIAGELASHSDTYTGIRALKGVGDYTAAAIAAFAYDLPHAVLDGNVYRVLARFSGLGRPSIPLPPKRSFRRWPRHYSIPPGPALITRLLSIWRHALYARQPACATCPLQKHCVAFKTGRANCP